MLAPQLIDSALELAPDAIVISDASGCIVFANRQAGPLFGYDPEEMLGQPIERLLPERLRARHLEHRAEFAAAPRARPMGEGIDLRARRKDGTEFPVEISLSPISQGDRSLVAAAIRDVTERKRIQNELLRARETAECARRSADEARELADRANQAKSRFLATASHDLRQPLQSLALLNGTLRRVVKQPEALEALAHQDRAINAMTRLLNALLDISKLESGAVKPEITDFTVSALFEELRQEFAQLALDKGLSLRVESCHGTLRSDPSLVEQIMRNLISNAIKYTSLGEVRVRCLRTSAQVRLEVADTGVGIPSDQLPYIFDEFFQVGARPNRARNGYGLGLSIVNRIVELLGLTLEVDSKPGQGSRFRLAVPAGGARTDECDDSQVPATTAERLALSTRKRILLVDDDAGVLRATSMLLKAEGFEVFAVASRAEALACVAEHPDIDLLITDFHLGTDGTGVEVIAAAREKLGAFLPAILLSGDTSRDVQQLAHDARWRIASKPLQAEQLLSLIGELLGN